MSHKPITAEHIVAAREHSIGSRRTRVHVIICHNLDQRSHTLYEMFRFADRVSPAALDALSRDLANDIIGDCDLLLTEIQNIKAFAQRQLAKLPAPPQE